MKKTIALIAIAGGMLLAPSAASAATVTVCATGCDHTTLQAGLAAANTGDTVSVGAGTYVVTSTIIVTDKALTIQGAGEGQSIIDGQDFIGTNASGNGTLRLVGGGYTIDGFTFRNPHRRAATGSGFFTHELFFRDSAAGESDTVSNVTFEGEGVGGGDYGLLTGPSAGSLTVTDSTFIDQAQNQILAEQHTGDLTVRDSTFDTANVTAGSVFGWTHGKTGAVPVDVTGDYLVENNDFNLDGAGAAVYVQTSEGGFNAVGKFTGDVTIRGNDVADANGTAIAVDDADPQAGGTRGEITGPVRITGNSVSGLGAGTGVFLRGRVLDAIASGNDIGGVATGLAIGNRGPVATPHAPVGANFRFNRVFDNTTGIDNSTAENLLAENNWFGCNEGPTDPDCDPVTSTGTGVTDADPWLVLGVDASPTEIETGGDTSDITASFARNSDGATPTGNDFPAPQTIAFATDLGTISPATDDTAAGDPTATSVLTSEAAAGTATVTASFDNADPTTEVEIVDPPTPPTPPDPPTPPAPPVLLPGPCANLQVGTPGPDQLVGTNAGDRLVGLEGDDDIAGLEDDDCLEGGGGDDAVAGGNGDDKVNGEGGDDRLSGGADRDRIKGGSGDDSIHGGFGRDKINGGAGDDRIYTVDGDKDKIRCGKGTDRVKADEQDRVNSDCEKVKLV